MRKVISLLVAVVLCAVMAVPAFAADVEFVPSITAKPAPEIIGDSQSDAVEGSGTDKVEEPVIIVKDENEEVVYQAPVQHLVVTAVSQIQDDTAEVTISEEAVQTLQQAYEQLNDESFVLLTEVPELVEELQVKAEEQVRAQLEAQGADAETIESAVAALKENTVLADTAVVTALFDVTVLTEELEEYLNVEGHTVDLTFEVDIPQGHTVVVMVYKHDKWQTVENVAVNGDGTITCTFEHFCPVAIMTVPLAQAVEDAIAAVAPEYAAPATTPAASSDASQAPVAAATVASAKAGFAWWWVVLAAIAVAGVVLSGKRAKK